MVQVTIQTEYTRLLKKSFVMNIANEVLKYLCISIEADLSIVVGSDDFIRDLNRRFRSEDKPTDVLSFPSDEIDPQTGSRYYGDIIISYPRTVAQAQAGDHKVEEELALLIVHGILHLLGYDHDEEDRQKEMWQLQNNILSNLGYDIKI